MDKETKNKKFIADMVAKAYTKKTVKESTKPKRRIKVNHRQRKFAANIVQKGMSQSAAYADAYGKDKPNNVTKANASTLMANSTVQVFVENMRQKYRDKAEWAFNEQVKLSQNKTVPPNIRNDIWNILQKRAGLDAPDISVIVGKVEHEHKFEDLTMSRNKLLELIQEPEKLVDDARLQIVEPITKKEVVEERPLEPSIGE